MSKRPLVCLVDPYGDGHHPMYAAVYAEACRELGAETWVVAPPSVTDWLSKSGHRADRCVPWEWEDKPVSRGIARARETATLLWQELGKILDKQATLSGRYPDFLMILYLDSFISEQLSGEVIERHVRCPFAGLWFKPPRPLGWTSRDVAKRFLRWGRRYRSLRSRLWAAIMLLDPEGTHAFQQKRNSQRIFRVPEFTVTALPAAEPPLIIEMRDRAAGRSVCSLVGSIEKRKGVRAFLRAAVAAPTSEWYFVIAGKVAWSTFDDELKTLLSDLAGGSDSRVLVADGWLDDETLNSVIADSALLHACYENWPYSSNMLCKAAAFQVPTVASDEGYLSRMVRRYNLGMVVPSPEEMPHLFRSGFSSRVSQIAESADFREGCKAYLLANSPEALTPALRVGLQGLVTGLG